MKKILALVMMLGLFACMAGTAMAATIADGACGSNLTWTLDDAGTLTISGTGAMTDYAGQDAPKVWKESQKVVVRSGVTTVGSYAFYDCDELTEVSLPETLVSLGEKAFTNCSGLKTIPLPDSITTIGENAFKNCDALTEFEIPEGVTTIADGTFGGCSSLKQVSIPASVKEMDAVKVFDSCFALEEIRVDSDNAHYKTIDGVLYTKDGTTLLYYPIEKKAESFTTPAGVTAIADSAIMFNKNIKTVTLTQGVTSIGSKAFYNCANMTAVTIPAGVTNIGDWAFYRCNVLKQMTIPASVMTLGDRAFASCISLETVTFAEGSRLTTIGQSAFDWCTELKQITIPVGVTSIGGNAFYNCSNLTTADVPCSWNEKQLYDFGNGVTVNLYHSPVYTASGNVLTELCSVCKKEHGAATITAQGGVYKDAPYMATVTETGTLAGKTWGITYWQNGEEINSTPTDAGSYTASMEIEGKRASVDFAITPAKLTVYGLQGVSRAYEAGNLKVALTGGELSGKQGNDDVTLDMTGAVGTMADDGAGENKPVTVTGAALTGDDAGNYVLVGQPSDVTVTIGQSATALTAKVDKTDYLYGEYVVVTVTPAATGVSAYGLRRLAQPQAGQVSLWNGSEQITEPQSAASGETVTFDLSTVADGLTPGSYTLTAKYEATDNMAAQTAQVSFAVAYVKTQKEAEASGKQLENGIYAESPTLTAPAGTQISSGIGADADWNDNLALPREEGTHTYTYYVKLPDGTIAEKQIMVTMDTTAPEVAEPTILVDPTMATITAPATDAVSGVLDYNLTQNSGKGELTIANNGGGSFTVTGMTPGETYGFTLTVRDKTGHTTAVSFSVTAPVPPVLPQTGDNSRMTLWLALMGMTGAAMLCLRRRARS